MLTRYVKTLDTDVYGKREVYPIIKFYYDRKNDEYSVYCCAPDNNVAGFILTAFDENTVAESLRKLAYFIEVVK